MTKTDGGRGERDAGRRRERETAVHDDPTTNNGRTFASPEGEQPLTEVITGGE
jgi:hypothetical protein